MGIFANFQRFAMEQTRRALCAKDNARVVKVDGYGIYWHIPLNANLVDGPFTKKEIKLEQFATFLGCAMTKTRAAYVPEVNTFFYKEPTVMRIDFLP